MKKSIKLSAITVLALTAGAANAIELTGGDLNLGYSAFTTDAGGNTLSKLSLDGAAELGFNRNFAAQLDVGLYDFNASGADGQNATLDGIYHVNDQTSFGAFYGHDSIEDADADFFGLEAGYEANGFSLRPVLHLRWPADAIRQIILGVGQRDQNLRGF